MASLKEDVAEFVALADKPGKDVVLSLTAKGLLLIERLKNEDSVPDGTLDVLTSDARKVALSLVVLGILGAATGTEIKIPPLMSEVSK